VNLPPPIDVVKNFIESKIQLIYFKVQPTVIIFDNVELLCKNLERIDF